MRRLDPTRQVYGLSQYTFTQFSSRSVSAAESAKENLDSDQIIKSEVGTELDPAWRLVSIRVRSFSGKVEEKEGLTCRRLIHQYGVSNDGLYFMTFISR